MLNKYFLYILVLFVDFVYKQGCINRETCSHPELTQDRVLTSGYVIICYTVAKNAEGKKTVLDFPSTNMQ